MIENSSRPYGAAFIDNEKIAIVSRCKPECLHEVRIVSLNNPLVPYFLPIYRLWLYFTVHSTPAANIDRPTYLIPALLEGNRILYPRPSGEWPNVGIFSFHNKRILESQPIQFEGIFSGKQGHRSLHAIRYIPELRLLSVDSGDSGCILLARLDQYGGRTTLISDRKFCVDSTIDSERVENTFFSSADGRQGAFVSRPLGFGGKWSFVSAGSLRASQSRKILQFRGVTGDVVLRDNIIAITYSSYDMPARFVHSSLTLASKDMGRTAEVPFQGIATVDATAQRVHSVPLKQIDSAMNAPVIQFCLKKGATSLTFLSNVSRILNSEVLDEWRSGGYQYLASSADNSLAAFRRGNRVYVYRLNGINC